MYAKDGSILDRREQLRVKLKNLGDEARTIRKEELRISGQLHHELWFHRVTVVRGEARSTHLAYGLIKGRTLQQMEVKSETPPDWERIRKLVAKYGPAGMVVVPVPLAKAA